MNKMWVFFGVFFCIVAFDWLTNSFATNGKQDYDLSTVYVNNVRSGDFMVKIVRQTRQQETVKPRFIMASRYGIINVC